MMINKNSYLISIKIQLHFLWKFFPHHLKVEDFLILLKYLGILIKCTLKTTSLPNDSQTFDYKFISLFFIFGCLKKKLTFLLLCFVLKTLINDERNSLIYFATFVEEEEAFSKQKQKKIAFICFQFMSLLLFFFVQIASF